MNKKTVSLILLVIFVISILLSCVNLLMEDSNTLENENGTLTINNTTVHFEKSGKCLEVIDGNTIQVYGVGRVQLTQVDTPQAGQNGFGMAKSFVEEKCLGKIVYLDIDDANPKDKYDRTLAIVYTDTADVNKELIEKGLANISYFEPSEFKKGEI